MSTGLRSVEVVCFLRFLLCSPAPTRGRLGPASASAFPTPLLFRFFLPEIVGSILGSMAARGLGNDVLQHQDGAGRVLSSAISQSALAHRHLDLVDGDLEIRDEVGQRL